MGTWLQWFLGICGVSEISNPEKAAEEWGGSVKLVREKNVQNLRENVDIGQDLPLQTRKGPHPLLGRSSPTPCGMDLNSRWSLGWTPSLTNSVAMFNKPEVVSPFPRLPYSSPFPFIMEEMPCVRHLKRTSKKVAYNYIT